MIINNLKFVIIKMSDTLKFGFDIDSVYRAMIFIIGLYEGITDQTVRLVSLNTFPAEVSQYVETNTPTIPKHKNFKNIKFITETFSERINRLYELLLSFSESECEKDNDFKVSSEDLYLKFKTYINEDINNNKDFPVLMKRYLENNLNITKRQTRVGSIYEGIRIKPIIHNRLIKSMSNRYDNFKISPLINNIAIPSIVSLSSNYNQNENTSNDSKIKQSGSESINNHTNMITLNPKEEIQTPIQVSILPKVELNAKNEASPSEHNIISPTVGHIVASSINNEKSPINLTIRPRVLTMNSSLQNSSINSDITSKFDPGASPKLSTNNDTEQSTKIQSSTINNTALVINHITTSQNQVTDIYTPSPINLTVQNSLINNNIASTVNLALHNSMINNIVTPVNLKSQNLMINNNNVPTDILSSHRLPLNNNILTVNSNIVTLNPHTKNNLDRGRTRCNNMSQIRTNNNNSNVIPSGITGPPSAIPLVNPKIPISKYPTLY